MRGLDEGGEMTGEMSAGVELRPVTPLGILTQRLERLRSRLHVERVDAEVLAELDHTLALAQGLDPYVARNTSPESADLEALARRTAEATWGSGGLEAEMLSGHVEGQLLKMLVHATKARQVLEIGMFTGYAALAMAEALPADGAVVTCEIDADVARTAQESFATSPVVGRIDVRVGPAIDTLATLAAEGRTFDFVFIDADKAGYVEYLHVLLARGLLTPSALIAVDNTLMQGEAYLSGERSANGTAIAHFNAVVAGDPRVEQVIVPLRDGVTLIRQVHR